MSNMVLNIARHASFAGLALVATSLVLSFTAVPAQAAGVRAKVTASAQASVAPRARVEARVRPAVRDTCVCDRHSLRLLAEARRIATAAYI